MEEIIRTILFEWKERKLPDTIDREIDLLDYASMKIRKIIVITGFRRTGKTYLVYNLIKKLLNKKSREELVHINFEDERIPMKTEFLTALIPTVKQTYDKKTEFLFLDEVHVIPNWSKWLRRIYDREDMKIFVTGSSSKMSSKEIPTELRGRFLEVKLLPLSLKEFLEFKNIVIDLEAIKHSEDEKARLVRALDEYVRLGGLPEVVLADESKKFEIVLSYYNTVIRRDIIERFNVRNEESLKALLRLLLNSTSYTISKMYNNLKSLGFKVGKTTVQNYLGYVGNSYFIHSVPIFSFKVKDQLQYARKVYFVDNAFINFLSTKFSKNMGRLYENLVFLELKRRQLRGNYKIFYWRSQAKEEVDFVVKGETKVKQLIQVCYDITDYETRRRETRSLLKAAKELGCRDLLVITRDKEGEEKMGGERIMYVPLWMWLLKI